MANLRKYALETSPVADCENMHSAKIILSPYARPLVAYSPLTLASLRMLPCRTHCPRPSMCIMYGCGTACGTTLFARYCHVTPRQKPPKVGSGGFGDGAPPGAVRAWIGLSGRFLALAICPRRATHAGIRGYGPRRHLEALVISARSRPLEVGSRSRRDHSRLAKPPWAVATYTSVHSAPSAYR